MALYEREGPRLPIMLKGIVGFSFAAIALVGATTPKLGLEATPTVMLITAVVGALVGAAVAYTGARHSHN